MRKYFIVGTAGHVDHGKSTLIKALTGIETDRLPEEKARGLSIDLGFAHLSLPGDVVAGVVDVPGHERFLKNMLAGVGGYDFGMLVVDAQEGVMPQTREHVEILDLLHTPRGMVVVTKADSVDSEFMELVQDDIRDFLKGTFLENAPMLAVSAKTGKGLDELKTVLAEQLGKGQPRDRKAPFRLPIDRAFLKTGFGTVVTGSLWSGTLRKGDTVVILPAGVETKVRGLQVHGHNADEAVAGQRVAVNLSGVEPGSVGRGQVLSPPNLLTPTTRVDVRIDVLARAPRGVKHRARIRLYTGTQEALGRIILLEGDVLEPGQTALAQLLLEQPTVVLQGDRFILRDFTASYTLGGGDVLNPQADPHKRRDEEMLASLRQRELGSVEETVLAGLRTSPGGFKLASALATQLQMQLPQLNETLQRLVEQGRVAPVGKGFAVAETVETLEEQFEAVLAELQNSAPWKTGWRKEELLKLLDFDQPKVAEEVLFHLLATGKLKEKGRWISSSHHQPTLNATQQQMLERLKTVLRGAGFSPPPWEEVPAAARIDPASWKIIESFVLDQGICVRIAADIVYLSETLEQVREVLRGLGNFTPAQARDALQSSRKYMIPLLEYLDQSGFSQRTGESRVVLAGR